MTVSMEPFRRNKPLEQVCTYLFEVFEVPLVVLARPVSWEIGGLLVLHNFSADMELLQRLLANLKHAVMIADIPCARPARQNLEEPCWCSWVFATEVRGRAALNFGTF